MINETLREFPMTISNKNQEITQKSLGEHFRLAREGLNLSLDDVSKQLNLRPAILQYLENNEFEHSSISATYIKGYIRNYARFLRLPESIWEPVALSLVETAKNDLVRGVRGNCAVNEYSKHNRWIGWISAVVIVILLTLTTLWWWENYQKSSAERDNLVKNYVETQKEQNTEPKAGNIDVSESLKEEKRSTDLSTEDSMNSVVKPTDVVLEQPIEKIQSETSTQVLQSELDRINTETDQPIENNLSSASTSEAASASNTEVLRIEITGTNCWISVKDANRKVLAQKEYKQGEILTFDQNEPYSLIIGAPGNVKVTYKGEDYPLKVDGRIAKFKLQ